MPSSSAAIASILAERRPGVWQSRTALSRACTLASIPPWPTAPNQRRSSSARRYSAQCVSAASRFTHSAAAASSSLGDSGSALPGCDRCLVARTHARAADTRTGSSGRFLEASSATGAPMEARFAPAPMEAKFAPATSTLAAFAPATHRRHESVGVATCSRSSFHAAATCSPEGVLNSPAQERRCWCWKLFAEMLLRQLGHHRLPGSSRAEWVLPSMPFAAEWKTSLLSGSWNQTTVRFLPLRRK
mmetsp:Transcript_1282/g.3831  ORF Transcript_1282/g.3831 Transcript_1282/m.3831 type:complete len:245 (-) Transcript_1282:521-1255(-)